MANNTPVQPTDEQIENDIVNWAKKQTIGSAVNTRKEDELPDLEDDDIKKWVERSKLKS